MRSRFRFVMLGLLVAAGLALAPAAFARGHVNLGINIGLPGISLGYSGCHHCGGGFGYYGGGYYGGGYGGYYRGYAAPAYGVSYYEPVYYSAPAYGAVYYSGRPHYRGYGGHHYRHDDRYEGHRASYYDRGGYYHH